MPPIQEGGTEAENMMTRLLQLNLNHCEAAQELLRQSVREWNVDIAILSEPYKKVNSPGWVYDATEGSAIWSVDGRILQNSMTSECGFVRTTISGIAVYSCYIPPRYDINEYKRIINILTTDAVGKNPILIAGDFNAWATEWGCPRTNERGKILLEALALLDVVLLNSGNEHTFNRNGGGSIIDIAFASSGICNRISWQIWDGYTHSDHSAIIMNIGNPVSAVTTAVRQKLPGWKSNTFDKEIFRLYIENMELSGSPEEMAEQLIYYITRSCNVAMKKRKHGGTKPPVYWWNNEIAELRRECVRARRVYTRNRGGLNNDIQHQILKTKKKALKSAIRRSKRTSFLTICDDVDNNPFGLAYKLVTKKLKCLSVPSPTEDNILGNIVAHLFPQMDATTWATSSSQDRFRFPEVTIFEVQMAVSKFEDRKAPGLDGIPNLVLKEVVKCSADKILQLINTCMRQGSFPSIWKRQKLVLLPKDGKPLDVPSSYRPLCMIDTCGKLLESIICQRLEKHTESVAGVSDNQFGFRKHRSTIDAIKVVVDIAKEAIEGKSWRNGAKEYCIVVTLDVKNAFNTANWGNIVNSLRRIDTPEYLVAIIQDYFRKRVLVYGTDRGTREYNVTGGVPQGSILGPLLWNIMYDGVLRLNLPERVKIIGFADDIALTIVGKTIDETRTVAESSIFVVKSWLNAMGLLLAEHKTEAVLITGRKVVEYTNLRIGDCNIMTKDCLKYLGVMIDNRLSFKYHFEYVRAKAGNTCAAIHRIMPNTRGPKYLRRKVLAGVLKSTILYGAPIWAESSRLKTYASKINSVYRLTALRVCCAYRTVSDEAAFVIAAMVPVDILAREAKYVYELRGIPGNESAIRNVRRDSIVEWQSRWSASRKGRWTYTLIPNIEVWWNRKHGYVNFYLSQFLSGHGCFRSYLYRFGLDTSPFCPSCAESEEDPAHVFFNCARFDSDRENLQRLVGSRVYPANIVRVMLTSLDNWEYVCEFIKLVLLELRRQEKIRRGME